MDRPGKAEMAKDYREYATKEITPTMEAFAEWLTKETGYKVDARTVALAGSLRSDFQASEFWKADARNYKANIEANREAKAAAKVEAAKVAAKKAQERVAKAEADAKTAIAKAKAKAADAATAEADAKAEGKAA